MENPVTGVGRRACGVVASLGLLAATGLGSTSADRERRSLEGELDPRDQYAFAPALLRAKSIPDEAERGEAFIRLESEWTGRRYRWAVRIVPKLCDAAARVCNALPFDHTRFAAPVVQGWLPRLAFAGEAEYADFELACAGFGRGGCIIRFEGRLSMLQVSDWLPTSLAFSDVRMLDARSAELSGVWIRGARR